LSYITDLCHFIRIRYDLFKSIYLIEYLALYAIMPLRFMHSVQRLAVTH